MDKKSMNPVVHFEMPYEDSSRLTAFYTNAFGWKMNELPEEMGGYVTAYTTETDENRMVRTPGTINGGFFKKTAGQTQLPSVVIAVDDIDEAMNNIVEFGGKVPDAPVEIPGIGRYIAFTDTEGNRVGALQPKNR